MSKKTEKRMITGLDIGTSKVTAIVGEVSGDGAIEIIGVGSSPSRGLKKGVVVNIESTVGAIQRAVEVAEQMADCQFQSVYTSIAGSHISSRNSNGTVPIGNNEVRQEDVERVIESARAVPISADQKILHVLPQEFVIDNQEGIRHPIGMSGVRLEAKVHIITGALGAAQNVTKCVERCGLSVDEIILQQLASSWAVLSADEKELGVCLVDIGGGTTDITIFTSGAICHSATIPIAGDQVTNDIAVALRTPTHHAERIKIDYACCLTQLAPEEMISVPSMGDRPSRQLSRQNLADVVRPRYQEIFEFVQSRLQRSGFESLIDAGIVLTGGGSKIEGVVELAEEIFHMPVRQGMPQFVTGLEETVRDPVYATAVGLLLFEHERQNYRISTFRAPTESWVSRLKRWF